MRNPVFLVIALLFVIAPAAFAQQKNDFSIFVNGPASLAGGSAGTRADGGIGVSFARLFTPRISGQLSFSFEQRRSYPYVVNANGSITQVTQATLHTFPIDATARYHLFDDSRWKPYLGAGFRYVGAPSADSRFGYQSHLNPEIVGGTIYQIRPSIGIVLEGKQLLGNREPYDPSFKASAGMSWRW
jgi:outer membrane protein W